MSTHTPGPWTYSEGNENDYIVHVERDAEAVAVVIHGHEANARLIAAAPALLEALEAYLVCDRRLGETAAAAKMDSDISYALHKAHQKARAAIAQAKGEGT